MSCESSQRKNNRRQKSIMTTLKKIKKEKKTKSLMARTHGKNSWEQLLTNREWLKKKESDIRMDEAREWWKAWDKEMADDGLEG